MGDTMLKARPPRIVLDTNVLYAALRSSTGASYRLVRLVGTGRFEIVLSVPLVLEYEAAISTLVSSGPLTGSDVTAVLDYVCAVARHQDIFFLWRPFLRDPGDDLVLEVAVAGSCDHIVTFNLRDFKGIEQFGVTCLTPINFLRRIGDFP
jgi:predicted nucleic acid-binding protein